MIGGDLNLTSYIKTTFFYYHSDRLSQCVNVNQKYLKTL